MKYIRNSVCITYVFSLCSKLTDSQLYVLASDSYQGQKHFFLSRWTWISKKGILIKLFKTVVYYTLLV